MSNTKKLNSEEQLLLKDVFLIKIYEDSLDAYNRYLFPLDFLTFTKPTHLPPKFRQRSRLHPRYIVISLAYHSSTVLR